MIRQCPLGSGSFSTKAHMFGAFAVHLQLVYVKIGRRTENLSTCDTGSFRGIYCSFRQTAVPQPHMSGQLEVQVELLVTEPTKQFFVAVRIHVSLHLFVADGFTAN